jgi:DNA-directed RNA polymerase sigma subunit (sigma70/sigma32)
MSRRFKEERHMALHEVAQRLFDEGYTETVLSRERIRQIEKRAIQKIKTVLDGKGMTFADLSPRELGDGDTIYAEDRDP